MARYEEIVIDVPKIGRAYEDIFSGNGDIYECVNIEDGYQKRFIMKERNSGNIAFYQAFGWKLVE